MADSAPARKGKGAYERREYKWLGVLTVMDALLIKLVLFLTIGLASGLDTEVKWTRSRDAGPQAAHKGRADERERGWRVEIAKEFSLLSESPSI